MSFYVCSSTQLGKSCFSRTTSGTFGSRSHLSHADYIVSPNTGWNNFLFWKRLLSPMVLNCRTRTFLQMIEFIFSICLSSQSGSNFLWFLLYSNSLTLSVSHIRAFFLHEQRKLCILNQRRALSLGGTTISSD